MNLIISIIKFIFELFQDNRSSPPTPINPIDLDHLFKLHNEVRTIRGLSPLVFDIRLSNAANKHASWMKTNNKMSHTGAQGSNHAARIRLENYKASFSGENVAYGYRDTEAVFKGWMNSSGHRSNILSPRYMHIGLGVADGYWCVVFATPGSFAAADSAPFDYIYEPDPITPGDTTA